jgi:hypothetical protein
MLRATLSKYTFLGVMIGAGSAFGGPAFAQSNSTPSNALEAFAQDKPGPDLKEMTPVERLLAIEEIRQLPLRYSRCINERDWKCWKALFAPDFYYDAGRVRYHGPDGIMRFVTTVGLTDRINVVSETHGAEIQVLSPTRARGIWGATLRLYYPPNEPYKTTGKEILAPGQYMTDYTEYYQTYVKIGDEWKIETSEEVATRMDRGPVIYIPKHTTPPPKFP